MEQQKKKNLRIIAFILILLVASVGLFIYMNAKLDAQIEADNNNTLSLSSSVKNLITDDRAGQLKETPIEVQLPVNFEKYIYLSYGNTGDGEVNYAYVVNSDVNEELNTLDNISATDLDGVILNDIHLELKGYYAEDDAIGNLVSAITNQEKEEKATGTKAYKICRILTYISLPDETIVRRDSIWGSEPPRRIKRGESGMGSWPDDDEIVKAIKNTIK